MNVQKPVLCLVLSLFCLPLALPSPRAEAAEDSLRVAISDFPPVIMAAESPYTGFEIELWEAVAREAGFTFKYHSTDFQSLLSEVEKGKADIGMAGISVTEARERILDFSHPHLDAGLAILVRSTKEISLESVMDNLLSPKIWKPVLYLLLFIIICGHVVWYVDKGRDDIDDRYFPGIFEAFWWAIVTMTTVGYGDIAPKKWLARFCAVLVMLSGIAFFGWFVAVLSSSLSFERLAGDIRTEADLRGKMVATKSGSTSVEVLRDLKATVRTVADLEGATRLLRAREVDAVVFDAPTLKYLVLNDPESEFALTGGSFTRQRYAFAFPEGSGLRERVDQALLKIVESGYYEKLRARWFGQ